MNNRVVTDNQPLIIPAVNKVNPTAPFRWLAAGWQDFRANPLASGFYGLALVLAGMLVISASVLINARLRSSVSWY